ncbi:hypothetical protein TMatcc_000542 [Talaromyces marneffei ATCC 18224]
MTVKMRAMDLRRSPLRDLLDTKLAELSLQLIELLGEVVLALSPELSSLNLGARLFFIEKTQVSTFRKSIDSKKSVLAEKFIGSHTILAASSRLS